MEQRYRGRKTPPTPLWVFAAIGLLAGTEPLSHLWLTYFLPEGSVATGLRTGDSHVYLQSMRIFQNGFFSPYASCASEFGQASIRYFVLPANWLYGVLGMLASAAGLNHFLALGLFNGLAGFLYLWAAYRFMSAAAPRLSNIAFGLFVLGGSPSGLLYGITGAMGLHASSNFDAYFYRYAVYDLMEGPHLWPVTVLPRLYYTLSLACCLSAFTLTIRFLEGRGKAFAVVGSILLFLGQLINIRVGTFAFAAIFLYLLWSSSLSPRIRVRVGAGAAGAVAAGAGLVLFATRFHPAYSANHFAAVREAMWVSPFVCGTVLLLPLCLWAVPRSLDRLPRPLDLLGWALAGYLAVFAALYAAYIVYYGEYLRPNDVSSAIRISDWALTGLALGAATRWYTRRAAEGNSADAALPGWVTLWLLLFVVLAISAWGQGWYMRLAPRRMMVLIGIPLALVSAQGLSTLWQRRKEWALAWGGVYSLCGVSTIVVALLFFQGPLGREAGEGPFAYAHYEIMTGADGRMLEALPPGRVLTPMYNPWCFSDAIALRQGNTVAAGVGTFNHSDLAFDTMKEEVARFFSLGETRQERRAFVDRWCIDIVYCPDTTPVPQDVVSELAATPWLRERSREGRGAMFEVVEP